MGSSPGLHCMIVFSLMPDWYLNFISSRTAMIQLGHSAWSFSLVIQLSHSAWSLKVFGVSRGHFLRPIAVSILNFTLFRLTFGVNLVLVLVFTKFALYN